eukprot:1157000-Pelagomonas_calceolata.AAC.2
MQAVKTLHQEVWGLKGAHSDMHTMGTSRSTCTLWALHRAHAHYGHFTEHMHTMGTSRSTCAL